jgi:hypothetical protein
MSATINPATLLLERAEGRSRRRGGKARRNATLIAGCTILGLIIFASLAAPLITSYNPDTLDPLRPLAKPLSPGHLLGTDEYGRDIFARILYGGRIDLLIAFGATGVTLVVGTAIGLVSGYFGGWLDAILMRIVDLFFAFPFFVLVIAIVAVLGPSIFNMFVAIWLTSWISYARITRGHTIVVKGREYVLAAKALDVPPHPAERRLVRADLRDGRRSRERPARRGPRLPRARGKAAVTRVGRDDLRRPELHPQLVVALDPAGGRDRARRGGLQPARRRPRRRPSRR